MEGESLPLASAEDGLRYPFCLGLSKGARTRLLVHRNGALAFRQVLGSYAASRIGCQGIALRSASFLVPP